LPRTTSLRLIQHHEWRVSTEKPTEIRADSHDAQNSPAEQGTTQISPFPAGPAAGLKPRGPGKSSWLFGLSGCAAEEAAQPWTARSHSTKGTNLTDQPTTARSDQKADASNIVIKGNHFDIGSPDGKGRRMRVGADGRLAFFYDDVHVVTLNSGAT